MNTWNEYQPTDRNPWDLKKAGHLYRRAAFGATHAELQQAVKDGPKKAIDRLLQGGTVDPNFDATSDFMATPRSLPPSSVNTRLASWWLWRMLHTAHPLHEKLSLFWHNHFATSNAKVQEAQYMLRMYRTIRQHALGDFRGLLKAMTFEPAMLIWLDAKDSKKGKPNENYARELMELFSLGLGHYTEADIREAARAFTGYDVKNGRMKFDAKQHDAGSKSVLGKTGAWKAEDVVDICLAQPACARFLVRKLYAFLISDIATPSDDLIAPLADQFRSSGFNTAKLVETLLRSEHFFSDAAYRQKVKSPVEFALGIVRGLEGTAGPEPLAEALEQLGQALFAPPSVKGWDGGPTWLNAQTLLFRQNLALALTSTEDDLYGKRCDPVVTLKTHAIANDEGVVEFLLNVFLQGDVPQASRGKLLGYLRQAKNAKHPVYWSDDDVQHHRYRAVAHLALTLPEFQLN